ncbi:protein kinase [Leptolyngbya sp. ST-U4]|uniref:protein kinase domain-containing protein n=1 Tax=Leptolyngbya sp. ST-U4 TaxID=2933912 RepID=UPI003298111B
MDSIKRFQKLLPDRLLSGRYCVIRQLGSGGFSQTFLAKDTQLPGYPLCVVKQLHPHSKNMTRWQVAKRLFDTEAAVLYRLGNHDQIPRLLAHFEDNQEFFLVQEFIEGQPLDNRVLQWTEGQTLRRLHDILGILSFVHQQQVIHRDIKPSNLIRRHKDGKLVLIDFGAVKQVSTLLDDSPLEQPLTISIGTQGYMPPEQVSGSPRYSSDLYAVGMIGIQALTGVRPSQLQRDFQTGELLWQALDPPVSEAFAEILDRMVRYHFKDRYQTVEEPLQAIEQLIAEQGECPDDEPEEIGDFTTLMAFEESDEAAEAMGQDSSFGGIVPFVSVAEPFVTAAEDAADPVSPAFEKSFPADGNLEGTFLPKEFSPSEVAPTLAPSPFPVLPASATTPKTITLAGFQTSPWKLRLAIGGFVAAAIALSSHLIPSRLQSTVPASTVPTSSVPSATLPGQQPSDQAPVLPNLPCREPPPPSLPSSSKPSYEYADGTRYYGSLDANSLKGETAIHRPADGRGIMVFPTGNRYDGEFRNGKREGCGTYSFSNGKRYIGQFKADRFEGLGIWLLGDGNRYVGAFQNNRCHGDGIFLFNDGRSQRGTWQTGKLVNGNLSCDR